MALQKEITQTMNFQFPYAVSSWKNLTVNRKIRCSTFTFLEKLYRRNLTKNQRTAVFIQDVFVGIYCYYFFLKQKFARLFVFSFPRMYLSLSFFLLYNKAFYYPGPEYFYFSADLRLKCSHDYSKIPSLSMKRGSKSLHGVKSCTVLHCDRAHTASFYDFIV